MVFFVYIDEQTKDTQWILQVLGWRATNYVVNKLYVLLIDVVVLDTKQKVSCDLESQNQVMERAKDIEWGCIILYRLPNSRA